MKAVLAGPHSQLADVRTIVTGVFRRLYRQRNIVVHGGSTAGIALGGWCSSVFWGGASPGLCRRGFGAGAERGGLGARCRSGAALGRAAPRAPRR